MAVILDARYSKDEILETYLNEIYLGRRGAIAITGVGEAARYYFGKEVADLDLAESATIAGMIRAPNAYSPFRNPERTRERRNLILRLMREEGRIDEAALAEAAGAAAHAPHADARSGPRRRTSSTSSRASSPSVTARSSRPRACRSTRRSTSTCSWPDSAR